MFAADGRGNEHGGVCIGVERYIAQSYATERGTHRRCDLLARIENPAGIASHPMHERVREELANRYAVDIRFTGSVALPGRAIDYLLENITETAALVSAYTNKDYMATQADATPGPKSFFVTNSDSFAADFTYLSSRVSPVISEHLFFESGNARVLLWRIWGNAFVHYHLDKNVHEDDAAYDITVHVFTNSRMLRTILKSGLFQYFADRMFKGILEDVESAVRRFAADANPGEHLPHYYVSGLRSRLDPQPEALPAR